MPKEPLPDFVIKPPEPSHVNSLAELELAIGARSPDPPNPEESAGKLAYQIEYLSRSIESYRKQIWPEDDWNGGDWWRIASLGSTVIGNIKALSLESCVCLSILQVHPDYWRRGLGSILFESCVSWAGSVKNRKGEPLDRPMAVWIDKDNEPAIQFYKAKGFTDQPTRTTRFWHMTLRPQQGGQSYNDDKQRK